jgi:hypothetical protein
MVFGKNSLAFSCKDKEQIAQTVKVSENRLVGERGIGDFEGGNCPAFSPTTDCSG